MLFKIIYSEYMEYEEEVEATTIDEAKKKLEEEVTDGQAEPTSAQVCEYKVEPIV
jgi:hypothetical protein